MVTSGLKVQMAVSMQLQKALHCRDVMIHSTHDLIHDFDFTIRCDSQFYLNKIIIKTNYKLNVSFYYCLIP